MAHNEARVIARGAAAHNQAKMKMRSILDELNTIREELIKLRREVIRFQHSINLGKTVGTATNVVGAGLAVGGCAAALFTGGAAAAIPLSYAAARLTMTGVCVNATHDLANRDGSQRYIEIINNFVSDLQRRFEELETILDQYRKAVNWLMNSHGLNENVAVYLIKHFSKEKGRIASVAGSVAAFKAAVEMGKFFNGTLIILNVGGVVVDIVKIVNDWKSNHPVVEAIYYVFEQFQYIENHIKEKLFLMESFE